jgi:hypothetical protein
MFNFKDLLTILETDWKNVINDLLPKGDSLKLETSSLNDIISGSILVLLSSIIIFILFSCLVLDFEPLVLIIIFSIIVVIMLLFTLYNKNEVINPVIIYLYFIFSSIGMLGSFVLSILTIPLIMFNTKVCFILLIAYLVSMIGYAFLCTAYINHLRVVHDKYVLDNTVVKQTEIKLSTISINDISMHGNIKCSECNADISVNNLFCPNCGNKLK